MGLKVDIAGWRDLRLLVHRECVCATLAVEVANVGSEACAVFCMLVLLLVDKPACRVCVCMCESVCLCGIY